jgi:alpha-tubulin suppressor-like RCC1 family protein
MTHERSTGTAVGLIVSMLLIGGCGSESSQTGATGQVLLEPPAGVFTAAALPGKTATLDIVGVRTGIAMTVNSDGSVSATVSEVPVGTWDFRITYRAMSEVIATASGHGTVTANTTTVVSLTTLSFPAAAVAAGSNHSCARLTKKTVSCWGDNSSGQLGNGTTTSSSSPVKVSELIGVEAVAAGNSHSCATDKKTVWCWGDNSSGQLGVKTQDEPQDEPFLPVRVTGLPDVDVEAIAAGSNHSWARLTKKTVSCWGDNSSGQLGKGTITSSSSPVEVRTMRNGESLTSVTDVAAGDSHSCAVLNGGPTGIVKCWGTNSNGQLGSGAILVSHLPVQVVGIP